MNMTGRSQRRKGHDVADAQVVQHAYTTILDHFIRTGRAPHYTELATLLGVSPDEARALQHEAAAVAMGSWFAPDTDYIASWAPFSNVPTQYVVRVADDTTWYGQ